MFSFKNTAVRAVSEVAAGNLVYLLSPPEPRLALRVAHPKGAPGDEATYPAVLIFLSNVERRIMPLVDLGAAGYPCVDCGVRPEVVWDPPLQLLGQGARPDVGHPVLVENRFGISSSYGPGGRGQRMYWDPYTGGAIDPRPGTPAQIAIITRWRLGALDQTGVFREFIVFPDDFESLTAGEEPH